eukprot:3347348-Alexandrium_andersonii.AAC.1
MVGGAVKQMRFGSSSGAPHEKEHVQKLLREYHAEGVLEALYTLLPLVKTQLEVLCLAEVRVPDALPEFRDHAA